MPGIREQLKKKKKQYENIHFFFFYLFFFKKNMSTHQQQLRQPPSLPIHYDQMSPSPTPTVKPQHNEDPYTLDKYSEKQGL